MAKSWKRSHRILISGASGFLAFSERGRLGAWAGDDQTNESWRMGSGAVVAFGALTSMLMQCLDGQNDAEQRFGTLVQQRAFPLHTDGPGKAIRVVNDGSGAADPARASQSDLYQDLAPGRYFSASRAARVSCRRASSAPPPSAR